MTAAASAARCRCYLTRRRAIASYQVPEPPNVKTCLLQLSVGEGLGQVP
jgi:hypothetical protein